MEDNQNKPKYNQNFSIDCDQSMDTTDISAIKAANNKYVISVSPEAFYLDILQVKTEKFIKIKYSRNFIVKFHPYYNRIFLLTEKDNVGIYEIKKDKLEYEKIITITGHNQEIKIAEFSKINDKIMATYSLDNNIKIWNFEEPFSICNIQLSNLITISNIQIYKNLIFYLEQEKILS